jgi:Tol biopolymer transport system component
VRTRLLTVALVATLLVAAGGSETVLGATPGRFVFTQSLDGGFSSYVFTASEIGRNRRRIVRRRAIGRPSVSPDGSRVAFSGPLTDDSDGRYAIWVVHVGGAQLRRVTLPAVADMDPAWSPDGRWIAFTRTNRANLQSPCCVLARISTDGRRTVRTIAHTSGGSWPTWSLDSRSLAFAGRGGIWTVRADGTGARLIVRGSVTQPAWSPDGKRIAVVQATAGGRARIVSVRSTGGDARTVADPGGLVETPSWSVDGRAVYFTRYNGLGDEGRRSAEVWRAGGGRLTRMIRYRTPLFGIDHWGPR